MPQDVSAFSASAAALHARYGADQPAPPAWNDTIATLFAHRSVRAYLPDALPDGTAELLTAAAQSAATSSNMQMWSVVAVHDQARRERLAALAGNQRHIAEAPLFLLWIADTSRAARIGAAAGVEMEGLPYTETFMVAVIDAALAAQNATIAAESLGLGTVYIGSMRNNPEAVAAEIGLPPGAMVVFGLCVGRPDPAHPTAIRPRVPVSVVLNHERYSTTAEAEGLAAYEERFTAFQMAQSMPAEGWVSRVRTRLGTAKGLGGRHVMRDVLQRLGFPLK